MGGGRFSSSRGKQGAGRVQAGPWAVFQQKLFPGRSGRGRRQRGVTSHAWCWPGGAAGPRGYAIPSLRKPAQPRLTSWHSSKASHARGHPGLPGAAGAAGHTLEHGRQVHGDWAPGGDTSSSGPYPGSRGVPSSHCSWHPAHTTGTPRLPWAAHRREWGSASVPGTFGPDDQGGQHTRNGGHSRWVQASWAPGSARPAQGGGQGPATQGAVPAQTGLGVGQSGRSEGCSQEGLLRDETQKSQMGPRCEETTQGEAQGANKPQASGGDGAPGTAVGLPALGRGQCGDLERFALRNW